MNILNTTLFNQMIVAATPLIYTSIGGLYSERTGVVNIGLEGMMLSGAFFAVLGSYLTGNPWIGVLFAAIIGAVLGLIHAFLSVTLRADQIISGTAINIFAGGLTGYLLIVIFKTHGSTRDPVAQLPYIHFNAIEKLPFGKVISQVFFNQTPLVYLSLVLVILTWILLYKTPLGLHMRAVGENPEAADNMGINVYAVRYFGVIMSGVLAGIAGAQLSIGVLSQFVQGMSSGRGFIALAAMIFGKWKPWGAFWASLLFGFGEALASNLQGTSMAIPNQFFLMIPFILTMVVLAGFVGRSTPPAADGKPYEKENK